MTKKGEIERTSRPLVSFGVLIDNTIKELTCWDEIMSRYFNLWNDIAHVLQANVYVPLEIIILNQLEWERKMESKVFIIDMKGSNILLKLVNL